MTYDQQHYQHGGGYGAFPSYGDVHEHPAEDDHATEHAEHHHDGAPTHEGDHDEHGGQAGADEHEGEGEEHADPAPKAKPQTKKTPRLSPAAKRRADKRLIEHYDALRQATDQERQLVAVLLEQTGRNRLEPADLAVAVANGASCADTVKTIEQLLAITDPYDRIITTMSLDADDRSRVWKILFALELVTGSPIASDPAGTSKRLLVGLSALEGEPRDLFERAARLAAGS